MNIRDILEWVINLLAVRFHGLIGLFATTGLTAQAIENKKYLISVTDKTMRMTQNGDIYYYPDSDSLQCVIDSLQKFIEYDAEKVANTVILTQNLQPILICLSILIAILTIIGYMWRFSNWCKEIKANRLKRKLEKHNDWINSAYDSDLEP